MKKIVGLLSILLLMTMTTTGCGTKEEATSENLNASESQNDTATDSSGAEVETDSSERVSLNVGFDKNFPPYGYVDENGDYVGFDLDLAKEVCERRGWELILTPIDWDSKDMELTSGAIDCIWNGFTMTEDRLDAYTWSEPYVNNTQVFVVADDSGIESLSDLAGKLVEVQADSSALEALSNEEHTDLTASFAGLTQVSEYNTAFMDLEAGACDAIGMDIGVAEYQLASRESGFKILDETITTEYYGIGFALGNTELRDEVQETLYEMLDDGTFEKIATDWGLENSVCLSR